MAKKSDIILSSVSGILLVLGFPPFDLYPLAWIAIVPLLISLQGKNVRSSFFTGMLTGLVYFTGTIYWVSHSMLVYGNIPALLSYLALLLLCLCLALYIGTFSMLFNFLSRNSRLPATLTVPVLWVSLEFLRTYALTGFPWAMLGYTQYSFLPLIQVADVTGVYGVSFLVAAANGALYDLTFLRRRKPAGIRLSRLAGIIIFLFVVTASLLYGTEKLKGGESGEKIRVSIVQGNIEQDKKWNPDFQREVIDKYKELTTRTLPFNPDIIIWPESAMPFVFGYDKTLTRELITFQKQLNTYLLFGSVLVKDGNKDMLSNSAVLLSPTGSVVSVYDKMHLVPFGEYVPLRRFFPFIGKMVAAIGDFVRGNKSTVMQTPFAKIGNLICYEIIFPDLARKVTERGANLLVTITNDAWFGRTAAPYQHFSMAVFRAIENRVPVARSANTGISGFIDSRGRIMSKSDIFVDAILTEEISVGQERSFYSKYGDIFAFSCMIISTLLIIAGLWARPKQ